MYKCVRTQVDSSLTDLSLIPDLSHNDLCHFKVSILVPLQWGHQTLSCFGKFIIKQWMHFAFMEVIPHIGLFSFVCQCAGIGKGTQL
jgi:hypothetical protein